MNSVIFICAIVLFTTSCATAGYWKPSPVQEVSNGVHVIRSVSQKNLVLTVTSNGVPQQYTSNVTVAPLESSSPSLAQVWYVQKTVFYSQENLQLRLISTRSSFGNNNVDVELPQGSFYSYRNNWHIIPTKKSTFVIEWYKQRSFNTGSGLCLQNNGVGKSVGFVACRANKKEQQWTFESV